MSDTNIKQRIAVWMSEYTEYVPGSMSYPDYENDTDAAMRVLARMSLHNDDYGFCLEPTSTRWFVLQYQRSEICGERGEIAYEYEGPTPCAAICAVWLAVYGGEAENPIR